MKTRQAFVANSSSSSFVIAYRDITKEESYQNLPDWSKKLINKILKRVSSKEKFKTVEEYNEYVIENYGCEGDTIEETLEYNGERFNKTYRTTTDFIKQGYIITEAIVDYDDEKGYEFYNSLPDHDDGSGIILISAD